MLLVQKYGHYGKYGHLKYGYQKYGHHGILTPKIWTPEIWTTEVWTSKPWALRIRDTKWDNGHNEPKHYNNVTTMRNV